MTGATVAEVEVQCFGILQQVCGGPTLRVSIDRLPVRVAAVLAQLAQDVPAVGPYLGHTACAVGDEIVGRDADVHAGEALVLLPPVSGG